MIAAARFVRCGALAGLGIGLAASPSSWAWNSHGHRTITVLAIEGLPADTPEWLKEPRYTAMIAEESVEPDRWRGTRLAPLGHVNGPDHYLDVELLDEFGLSLSTLPPYRYDYLRALAIAKHEHPERVSPYDLAGDEQRQYEWPGFAAHAITEHHAKLVSSFNTLRILDAVAKARPDEADARTGQMELARLNVIFHMGTLSHYVGDMAQPLHATKHYNGWVGENPNGYITARSFHGYIDGGIVDHHRIDAASLRPGMTYTVRIDAKSPWNDTIAYIGRTFETVIPLYELQKCGDLEKEPGKAFIESRLREGAATLSAYYASAWQASEPTDEQVTSFLRFNPPPSAQSATGPAGATAADLARRAQDLMKEGKFDEGYAAAQTAMKRYTEEGDDLAWILLESIEVGDRRVAVHLNMGPRERQRPDQGIVRPLTFRVWSAEGRQLLESIDFEYAMFDGRPITAAFGRMDAGTHLNLGMLPVDSTYTLIREAIIARLKK